MQKLTHTCNKSHPTAIQQKTESLNGECLNLVLSGTFKHTILKHLFADLSPHPTPNLKNINSMTYDLQFTSYPGQY